MPQRLLTFVILAALACNAASYADTPAAAADPTTPNLLFGGFGTLGVVHSSERQADFTSTFYSPNGAGFTRPWSLSVDSLIAAQITASLDSHWSAVLQVISEQNYDNTFTPHVEWANIKYQFTRDFSVRVGRTALPIFMVTDSREIGYANPWVRPPDELYRIVPVRNNDGVDASYRMSIGSATNTIQVTAGRSNVNLPGGTFGVLTSQDREVGTFVDTYEQGFATVRFNYGRGRLTIPRFNELFDAFREFGPQGIAIADRYDVHERVASFVGASVSYDPGSWFLMSEWGRINTNSAAGETAAWYVSGGYRIGRFTPYATYSAAKSLSNRSDPGLNLADLPANLVATAAGLNFALNSILAFPPDQHSISAGARWDFAKNVDLKIQIDRKYLDAGSPGTLINIQPGFKPGGIVDLFSATVDFVF